jgi:ornithine racemase
MKAFLPRIEISLSQIRHNARILCERYGQKGISLMGVSKATLGDPAIAQAMIQGGVKFIADSRLENIQKMRQAGISSRFVLLRTTLSQAEAIVQSVDISLNTELATIQALSHYAGIHHKSHQIIVMVEMGDLREGVLARDLSGFIQTVLDLPHIQILGIGCNLACYGGVQPSDEKMLALSHLATSIEKSFQIKLDVVSGGNSANHDWCQGTHNVDRINNLRIGESILLGCEPLNRTAIPGLHTSAFSLIAEVIESKYKPSLPFGKLGQDAFGNMPTFQDRGIHHRVIIALGRQDVLITGLTPRSGLEILGASSDHVVLESQQDDCRVGSEDYGGLLSAMTSPFIQKAFVGS